jgi:hypothetical protein
MVKFVTYPFTIGFIECYDNFAFVSTVLQNGHCGS